MTTTLAVDSAGNIYLPHVYIVVRIGIDGNATQYAGPGFGPYNGAALEVALDVSGTLYVGTPTEIVKIAPGGSTSTVFDSPQLSASGGMATHPTRGLCYASAFNIFCVNSSGQRITLGGTGMAGFGGGDGGPATAAPLTNPKGLSFDSSGNLYLVETGTTRVRVISGSGTLNTLINAPTGPQVQYPKHIAVDAGGNLYVSDEGANVVWRVDTTGLATVIAGTGVSGFGADGVQATTSALFSPQGIAVDLEGKVYIAELGTHRIRVVGGDGVVQTIAGSGTAGFSGDGGQAKGAALNTPMDVAVDAAGNVFIADTYNNRIRRVSTVGVITTVAGSGPMQGFSSGATAGDGSSANAAVFNNPAWLTVGPSGDVYVGDGDRVRRFHPGSPLSGQITTVAGSGRCGPDGDGGQATSASNCYVAGLAVDVAGNLYMADQGNQRIRRVDPQGVVTVIAGTGTAGFSGDGGPAALAQFNIPWGVAVDKTGAVFVADLLNKRVRRINPGTRCGVTLSATSLATNAAASGGTLLVTPAPSCGYTASSDSDWLHIDGGGQSTGGGSVAYSIDANLGGGRKGTILVSVPGATGTFYVYQTGSSCLTSIIPSIISVPYYGISDYVPLNQNPSQCAAYTSSSDGPWLHVTGPPSYGAGYAVPYEVPNNPDAASRSGVITVGNQTYTVVQAASPVTMLSPAPGTPLRFGTVVFSWTSGGATQFRYEISGSPGWANLATGLTTGTSVSLNVAAQGGPDVYFRLWANIGGFWRPIPLDLKYPVLNDAVLAIQTSHTGYFSAGQTGAEYKLVVSNLVKLGAFGQPSGPTVGQVTMTDTLPSDLALVSMTGSGWTCTGNTCVRSDTLVPGQSYPPVTVVVNVAGNASSPQVNIAGVSGGISAPASATDPTIIVPSGSTVPVAVSVTPSSAGGASQLFSFTYAHPGGVAQLTSVYFLISTSGSGVNACYVEYNVAQNYLRVANDAGNAFTVPVNPAGFGTSGNSACAVSAADSSVSAGSTSITVNAAMIFKPVFNGARNVYGLAYDQAGGNSGLVALGAFTVNAAVPVLPAVLGLNSPASGSTLGTAVFQIDYSHATGASNLSSVYLLVSPHGAGAGACYMEYNNQANFLRIANDAATAFTVPVVPGTFGTSGNSQCAVSAANSSVSNPSSKILRLNANLIFRQSFNGAYNLYALAYDQQGNNSGLQLLGTIVVNAAVASPPSVVSCSGCTGAGSGGSFPVTYHSSLGASNIDSAYLLVSPNQSATGACYVQYIKGTNQIRLANDAGNGFLNAVVLGTPGTIANSQCSVNTGTTTAVASGADLTVNYQVSFQRPAFNGSKTMSCLVFDVTGLQSGMQVLGTFTVQ